MIGFKDFGLPHFVFQLGVHLKVGPRGRMGCLFEFLQKLTKSSLIVSKQTNEQNSQSQAKLRRQKDGRGLSDTLVKKDGQGMLRRERNSLEKMRLLENLKMGKLNMCFCHVTYLY